MSETTNVQVRMPTDWELRAAMIEGELAAEAARAMGEAARRIYRALKAKK